MQSQIFPGLGRSSGTIYAYTNDRSNEYQPVEGKVHCTIIDVYLSVNLKQKYVSRLRTEEEVVYILPLPPDASVYSFKATFNGGRVVKGVIKEKHQASEEYKAAVAKGRRAALLQNINDEIFHSSLGIIRPGETVEIELSFVSIIPNDGSTHSLRVMFPTSLFPRYGDPPRGVVDANTQSRTSEFTVSIQMTAPVKIVASPSHSLSVTLGQDFPDSGSSSSSTLQYDPRKAFVSFTGDDLLKENKDAVLVITSDGLDRPRCTAERVIRNGEETEACCLTLVPRFNLPPLPRQEYIFLVDRSGSMEGAPIKGVQRALQIMLKSLPTEGTTFNIISFGSDSSRLFPQCVPYTADSVKIASEHVASMDADMGGTEIASALELAFESRSKAAQTSLPTTIFILTDGETWDLEHVITIVKAEVERSPLTRVFSLGIGESVSQAMCNNIAKAGKGTAVYVTSNEKPDSKLMELLKTTRGSFVQDLEVDWGVDNELVDDFEMVPDTCDAASIAGPVSTKPIKLYNENATTRVDETKLGPDEKPVVLGPPPRIQQSRLSVIYAGTRVQIFAIIRLSSKDGAFVPRTIKITGTTSHNGETVSLEVPLSKADVSNFDPDNTVSGMLHILAARSLINSIESDGEGYLNMAEIVRLALRYNLASSQTSFLAVDEGTDQLVHARSEGLFAPMQEECEECDDDDDDMGFGLFNDCSRSVAAAPMGMMARSSVHSSEEEDQFQVKEGGEYDEYGGKEAAPAAKPKPPSYNYPFLSQAQDGPSPSAGGLASSNATSNMNQPPAHSVQRRKATEAVLDLEETVSEDMLTEITVAAQDFSDPFTTSEDKLTEITDAQEFDGSFNASAFLFATTEQRESAAVFPDALFKRMLGDDAVKTVLWHTALCLAWLELYLKEEEDVWSMMSEKAVRYIKMEAKKALAASEDETSKFVEDLLEEGKRRLASLLVGK